MISEVNCLSQKSFFFIHNHELNLDNESKILEFHLHSTNKINRFVLAYLKNGPFDQGPSKYSQLLYLTDERVQ